MHSLKKLYANYLSPLIDAVLISSILVYITHSDFFKNNLNSFPFL